MKRTAFVLAAVTLLSTVAATTASACYRPTKLVYQRVRLVRVRVLRRRLPHVSGAPGARVEQGCRAVGYAAKSFINPSHVTMRRGQRLVFAVWCSPRKRAAEKSFYRILYAPSKREVVKRGTTTVFGKLLRDAAGRYTLVSSRSVSSGKPRCSSRRGWKVIKRGRTVRWVWRSGF